MDDLTGYLKIYGTEYIFFIKEFQITLVPKEPISCKLEPYKRNEFDVLYGYLATGHQICLIDVILIKGFLPKIQGSLLAIAVGTRNTGDDISIEPFDIINFTGNSINRFYNPIRAFDKEKSSFDYQEGTQNIKIKAYDEVTKTHNITLNNVDFKMMFSVISKNTLSATNSSLGELFSTLKLISENDLDYKVIKSTYKFVINIFRFLNFRKNILFEKLIIQKTNEEGVGEVIAEVYVINKQKDTEISNIDAINYELMSENIESLFQYIGTSENYFLFVPKDDKEANFIDFSSYFITCTCFEYFYDKNYLKEIKVENIKKIKKSIKQFVKESSIIEEGIKSHLQNHIGQYNPSFIPLKLKFINVIKHEKEILKKLFKNVEFDDEFIEDISTEFAKQRNDIAHGRIDNLEGVLINPYIISLCLIYIMIMRESKVSEENIISSLKKIFRRYNLEDKRVEQK